MSSSPKYVGRHGSSGTPVATRLRALAGARQQTVAKSVVGVGLLVGTGVLAVSPTSAAEGGDSSAQASTQSAKTVSAVELLAGRSNDAPASRSQARAAVAAPSSGKASAAVRDFGMLEVEAVEKPKPKPKPKPTPKPQPEPEETAPEETAASTDQDDEASSTQEPTETTDDSSSSSSTSSDSPNTGSYASQARGLGLGPNAQGVYSAVRSQFPHLSNIGGYRAGDPGDHGTGRAVDIMCGSADGDAVAAWLQQQAGSLNITYIIWKQRIWLPGQGWRPMEDRGSATANHFDHVHVSVS